MNSLSGEAQKDKPKQFKGLPPIHRLYYQIVLSTLDGETLRQPEVAADFVKILLDLSKKEKYHIFSLQVLDGKVHIILSLRPNHTISEIVKNLKAITSKALKSKHPQLRNLSSLWTSGYFANSLGNKSVPEVVADLQEQGKNRRGG